MYIDTHCHLNFKAFAGGERTIIRKAQEMGVDTIVVPGTDALTSRTAVDIASENERVFALVGIHPHHAVQYRDQDPESRERDLELIRQWLTHEKVVGVGEVGLDRHTYSVSRYGPKMHVTADLFSLQVEILRRQIEYASSRGSSLALHNREAAADLIEVWDSMGDSTRALRGRTVLHCCEPEPALLDFAKENGMYIGIDGDVTYDRVKQDFIAQVPLDRIVLETDAPYLLPEPLRSQKKYPNTPMNIHLIAESLAMIKGITTQQVSETTSANARSLFNLPE